MYLFTILNKLQLIAPTSYRMKLMKIGLILCIRYKSFMDIFMHKRIKIIMIHALIKIFTEYNDYYF